MSAFLSIILAGAAVAPATPINGREWFTSNDHPKTALAVAERGQVIYSIDVAPDGKAIRCETPEQADLDRKVCEIIMKSARFLPAKDGQGAAAFGVHQGVASFLMPGNNTRPDRARLAVTVDSLPAGITGPAYVNLAFQVDGAGAISGCGQAPAAGGPGGGGGGRRRPQQDVTALVPAACEKIAADYRPAPARDAGGAAVASVQAVTVRFDLRPS